MNPFLKTLITVAAGIVLPALDAATSSIQPTGGFANALQSNQGYALLFAGGSLLAHNFITRIEAQLGIHPAQTEPASAAPAVH